jgi:hypothetical protein
MLTHVPAHRKTKTPLIAHTPPRVSDYVMPGNHKKEGAGLCTAHEIFRITIWALCIDPPLAKLIRGSWFAKVVISERSTEQIRELLDSFIARIRDESWQL